jgi:hypothetical protein
MQMVEYVLQPRDPKRHVGTPDHFVTEHPLVTSWCQQLADPAAASHATQVSPLPYNLTLMKVSYINNTLTTACSARLFPGRWAEACRHGLNPSIQPTQHLVYPYLTQWHVTLAVATLGPPQSTVNPASRNTNTGSTLRSPLAPRVLQLQTRVLKAAMKVVDFASTRAG